MENETEKAFVALLESASKLEDSLNFDTVKVALDQTVEFKKRFKGLESLIDKEAPGDFVPGEIVSPLIQWALDESSQKEEEEEFEGS